MYHLDNTSGVPEMPEPKDLQSISPRWFGESQEQGGISWPGADWFNVVQAELLNLLSAAGIQPEKAVFDQLSKAIPILGEKQIRRDLMSNLPGKGMSLSAAEQGGTAQDLVTWVTPQSQGSPCNGIDDDTLFFADMVLKFQKIFVPAGSYLIDCNKINITESDLELSFDCAAKITVINTSGKSGGNQEASVFKIKGTATSPVYNIKISGGQFSYTDDSVTLVGVNSYANTIAVTGVRGRGLRCLHATDGLDSYSNSSTQSRPKGIWATKNAFTAATVRTSGACAGFRYTENGGTNSNIFTGYFYGILWWGGNSNVGVDGSLSNERKAKGLRFNNDIITATKAGCWGSMGDDVCGNGLRVQAIDVLNSDVGLDLEGCTNSGFIGCYSKNFRYGQLATFYLNSGCYFDSCTAVADVEGAQLFRINNSTQNYLNNGIALTNCTLKGEGLIAYSYQNGAASNIKIKGCSFINAVTFLNSNNNGGIHIEGNYFEINILPLVGLTYGNYVLYSALIVDGFHSGSALAILRDNVFRTTVDWSGLGENAPLIIIGRGYNVNSKAQISGGGVLSSGWSNDIIFGNYGQNSAITLRYSVDNYIFYSKSYKTLLLNSSTLYPTGKVNGLTSLLANFPSSITDNAAYQNTYYISGQKFKSNSLKLGGYEAQIVISAGLGTSAVTGNSGGQIT